MSGELSLLSNSAGRFMVKIPFNDYTFRLVFIITCFEINEFV